MALNTPEDPRIPALPDSHGHAKGEHKPYAEERPIPYTARMLFLWFYHACRRGAPRFMMVSDHINYLTFEDPSAVNLVRRALKLAQAGDLYGAAETAGVELGHAATVSEGLRKGMRYSIGAEVDNDPRSRPDAQNIVDAMRPDGMLRSVHFLSITHPVHGEGWMWPFDNAEFSEFFDVVGVEKTWELYIATLLEAIEKLPGQIVAHFYVPAKFGHWPDDAALERYEDQLIEACARREMAIEVNSRYFYKYFAGNDEQLERYRKAHRRLLSKAKRKGVLVAVGSDAHSPKDQGGGFTEVLALLDQAEINEIAFPINGRLARVALRATEEILRQAAAPQAPLVGSSVSGFGRAELAAASRNGGAETHDEAAPVRPARPARRRPGAPEPAPAAAARGTGGAPEREPGGRKPVAAARASKRPAKAAANAPPEAQTGGESSGAAKKVALAKKPAAPVPPLKKPAPPAAKTAVIKKAPAKPAAPKKLAAAKGPAPAKRAAPVQKAAVKKAAPAKKTPAAKKPAAPKKAAPAKKAASRKKAAPAKKTVAKKAQVKRATPPKKAAPARKQAGRNQVARGKSPSPRAAAKSKRSQPARPSSAKKNVAKKKIKSHR